MTYKSNAIVMKSKAWPRNARLYVLYTRRFGKVRAVASGVTKIKSKVAGHLQHFCLTEVMLAQGKHIDRLAQARFVRGFQGIAQDYQTFVHGSYMLEILDQLTSEGIADQEIWTLTESALSLLNEQSLWRDGFDGGADDDKAFLARLYALQLLNRFGFGPELSCCLQCRNTLHPKALWLSVVHGGAMCPDCRGFAGDAFATNPSVIKILRAARSEPLSDLVKITLDPQTRQACLSYIDQLISFHTQKPLRTLLFLPSVKKEWSFV